MRVLYCLVYEHNLWLVLLAATMCIVGSFISMRLFERTIAHQGVARLHWCFLSAVTGGAAVWATHFIAMLGYRPGVPVTFSGTVTIFSAVIAVAGIAVGLSLATINARRTAIVLGGGIIGLSIAAMHYVGMFAYRVDGVVKWIPEYIVASLVVTSIFSMLAIAWLRHRPTGTSLIVPASLFVAAIIGLHFTGMAAFAVTPIAGISVGVDSDAFHAMAAAVAMVAMLVVGAGISTYLVERRTSTDSQKKLQHIAHHDSLTQIANRHAFNETLNRECERLERYGRPFAVLMVDLDRFKPINDTLGHPIGDRVLRMVAARLRSAVREGDLVARIGGDEFAIIAFGLKGTAEAKVLVERIVEVLARPYVVSGSVSELSGSVGIALAPQHGTVAQDLVRHADIALYTAKRDGKNRYCVFEPELNEALQRRRFLEADLRRACMREDFNVVYQPVKDPVSGRFTGAEALLRWHCPQRGEVPPSEFIPIAEEMGVVSRIGAGVLRQACRDAATWPSDLDIAVNVSPVQLLDPRLPQTVSQALQESGLAPERLELEITETALLGNDEIVMRILNKLRDLGVRISLDDFGTGYSSLSYLHRFPISRIKIDRSFVQQLPSDPGSLSIVRAISQLGESMNLKITAEGIESEEQLACVMQQGCNNVQGFLISRPIAHADISALFANNGTRVAA